MNLQNARCNNKEKYVYKCYLCPVRQRPGFACVGHYRQCPCDVDFPLIYLLIYLEVINPIAVRTKGRPNSRWKDEVLNDLNELQLRNWTQLFNNRKAWNDMLQKTNQHVG